MRWLELGILAEFADRSGIIRRTGGCSLIGRFEFGQRLEQLQELLEGLEPDRSWGDEYQRGGRFAHVVDRLLELNGLKTDWLTLDMVSNLLFVRAGESGEVLPGWLVSLNNPPRTRAQSGEPATLAECLAGLSESIVEALELGDGLPAQLLIDIAEARAELHKTPEERIQDKKRRIFEDLKNDSRLEDTIGGR